MRNSEKVIKKWEKDKQKGKFKYVLTNSILSATACWVGSIIGTVVHNGNLFHQLTDYNTYTHWEYFLWGLIGGIIGSLISWSNNKFDYDHLLNNK